MKPPKPMALSGLFLRYLLAVGAAMAAVAALLVLVLAGSIQWGLVLPANTAELEVKSCMDSLTRGTMAPEELPHYFRWARLDAEGALGEDAGLSTTHRKAMEKALNTGDYVVSAFPYSQYHRLVQRPDGGTYILQYDFSAPYATARLQRLLPDFQTAMLVLLLLLWVLAVALCTRWFVHILRRDAAALTAAARTIADRQLEKPFSGQTRVREFGETLGAMDQLRQSLSDALQNQWAMEQRRQREIAALAHDLKTPLTIVGGNGELLAEEALPPAQRTMVDAIVRNARRMEDYLSQLRAAAGGQEPELRGQRPVELAELAEEWRRAGEGLCAPKNIRFTGAGPGSITCVLDGARVGRAVLNLLDNAVRYTPAGGAVSLSVQAVGERLEIWVRDTGPGFSQEALARGGYALYTGDASRSDHGHMGMGLCFARQVAGEHGGQLRLENDGGGGAALILPLKPAL